MRLGVLDVGSNTVHLLVVDAHPGAQPLPAYSHTMDLHLVEFTDDQGAITDEGQRQLRDCVANALTLAEDKGVENLLTLATSAVREASNGAEVLASIHDTTGVDLSVLSGEDEARLTFLAVRRWYGWSAGRLLVLDIGGGSLEVAAGADELPEVAVSVPLGAARLTHEMLPGDPPDAEHVRALRKHVRVEIARVARDVLRGGVPDRTVVTSKTFRQLARISGSAPSSMGPRVARGLRHESLVTWAGKLARMTVAQRAELPGVSGRRAPQLLAGAVVADAAFDLFHVSAAEVCPWALREGVILRRLDALSVPS